jgi:(4-O-methyl)-D-glucuronate---lignin esterase
MKGRLCFCVALFLSAAASLAGSGSAPALEEAWRNPPLNARLRAYWWWLNGNVTREAITRDLEEMKAKGFGGAVIVDAGGAEQDGNERVPHGPTFFTPEWRELFKHTLREANRLGLEMSFNIQSGWNLGGPMVKPEDAAKKLAWSETRVTGPTNFNQALTSPRSRDGFYQELFVVAYRTKPDSTPRAIQNWQEKAMYRALHFSAPDTTPLLRDVPMVAGEEETGSADVLDLTAKLGEGGVLRWDVPEGEWQILRFGCTIGDHSKVSTCSDGWQGYALDVLDTGAFQRYWDAVVEPLIEDAGPLAGNTLKYLHTDSWEVEAVNWTPTLREEFRQRRGYDLVPFLPVLAGRIVDSRPVSNRFLDDFRKTLGDLAIDHHYRPMRENAMKHHLDIHPESGGPHASPIDAQRCLGWNDAPMSEFWAWSWRHRVGDENRFFIKQPASAAHTYGRRLVLGEGFTTIGPHWQETVWDNLKPSFDKALCEGLNLLVWHAVVCSPAEMGLPGQQYFAGTHFNPNTTWWSKSAPFLSYINRCQAMLQRGLFVADVCYYYGDHVPNFAQLKRSDPARVLPGYDYDVITEEALLERISMRDGRLVLPDGMSYRLLALPNRTMISLPVLRKLKELVAAGATVVGPAPVMASGLKDYPQSDAEVVKLASELWKNSSASSVKENAYGKGRVIWGRNSREVLLADGLRPDFEYRGANSDAMVDYIHRSADDAEIYFVASRSNRWEDVVCTFRVSGKAPEIWDAVTGERRWAAAYAEQQDGRITVPLEFSPCGSFFVVFRERASAHPATASGNTLKLESRHDLTGTWTVKFDPKWGAPETAAFDRLVSWTTRPEPGIRYYSGTATYVKTFDVPSALMRSRQRLWLDLGNLRELAEVRLNGKNLGILWAPPFRVQVGDVIKAGGNVLEVEVVNFWPNRLIGDQFQPADARLTKTNIRKLTRDTPLMESGLLGPVRLLEQH